MNSANVAHTGIYGTGALTGAALGGLLGVGVGLIVALVLSRLSERRPSQNCID